MRDPFLPWKSTERIFTPQEANRMLQEIKPLIRSLMVKKKDAERIKNMIEKYRLLGASEYYLQEKAEKLERLTDEIISIIDEIGNMGVIVRDIDQGLVDFPAERYGERVYLCWKYGEKEIAYWHEAREGFLGRKPIKIRVVPR